ncbi:MAG: hypothetical protein IJO22_06175 [Oscillospiraceae bacterium]|nr:hypothetical protein [Oscillospiraceae bacterium]
MKKKNRDELIMQELLEGYLEDVNEVPSEDFFVEEEFEHGENEPEHENTGENDRKLKAIFEFANAIGEDPGKIADVFIKGMEYDELNKKFGKAREDTEVFEKLAVLRGISPEEMKNEIIWALEKATIEKTVDEIIEENPGMNRETARELANFRLGMKRKAEDENEEDKSEEMLLELEKFLELHSAENIHYIDGKVVEEWEKGIPLEAAFEKFCLLKEKNKLAEEIEKLRADCIKEAQKKYAKEFGPGSATSAAGTSGTDDFIVGLFKEY